MSSLLSIRECTGCPEIATGPEPNGTAQPIGKSSTTDRQQSDARNCEKALPIAFTEAAKRLTVTAFWYLIALRPTIYCLSSIASHFLTQLAH